jgi:hypothetical protein
MRWHRVALGLLALLSLSTRASASAEQDESCARRLTGQVAHDRLIVRCLLSVGRARAAIDRLKPWVKKHPERLGLARLLASAYRADNNAFWALRVLTRLLGNDEADCVSRAQLTLLHIDQGSLDLAREALSHPACPKTAVDRARWSLLEALLASAAGDTRAFEAAVRRAARSGGEMYPEDKQLWRHFRRRIGDEGQPPVQLRGELSYGYTSDVTAGLPLTEARESAASSVMHADLFGQFMLPLSWPVTPVLDSGLKVHLLEDFGHNEVNVHQANYVELNLRPALAATLSTDVRLLLGYRVDLFLLNGVDPPAIAEANPQGPYDAGFGPFYEGHRGELELELPLGLTVFAGAGYRAFRRRSRSRAEVDGGLGWAINPLTGVRLLTALAGRYYPSRGAEYEQIGATALVASTVQLGAGFHARLRLTGAFDRYPNAPANRGGRDLMGKLSLGFWSPSWAGLRAGARYEFARRDSTTDVSFSYTVHRALVALSWSLSWDPTLPRDVSPPDHVPMRYGIETTEGAERYQERVQDLLRQDETARRGSSCVN